MDLTRVLPGAALDPAAYAIGGHAPRAAARPASREELSELLRAAAADAMAIVPWGGGTSAPHTAVPERYDLAIDLTGLARIVEYDPEDLTLTAECGATLAVLRATLAARGQELPLEGAHADRATLGGVLAANASGARRLRFGAPRDRILGARMALGDGTIARTGGRVVKNVTGHAVHRLLCGSGGALGAFVEASLKLAPAPALRRALVFHATAAELGDGSRWAMLPRLEPAAVTVLGRATASAIVPAAAGPDATVIVVLEDDTPWVERQTALVEAALGTAAARLEGSAVEALEQALCDAPERWSRCLTFTTAWNSPAALAAIWGGAAARGLVLHALAGRLHLEPGADGAGAPWPAGDPWTRIDGRGVAGDPAPPHVFAALRELRGRIRTALDPAGAWAHGPGWSRGG